MSDSNDHKLIFILWKNTVHILSTTRQRYKDLWAVKLMSSNVNNLYFKAVQLHTQEPVDLNFNIYE